ncbi:MAG: DUF2779 domain-containing protein [Anaerotruncus sp.]|nr:DUF2779 domain-containing protein [Anaerotruncus sp.]
MNKQKIQTMLDTLKYPLYYLDFEANPSMLPKHRGEWPYCQSVFQFSIHREDGPDRCRIDDEATHFEYLITRPGDHREELVEALLAAIPEGDSSIIVYNRTFEKNRLLELATLFPEHRVRLLELEQTSVRSAQGRQERRALLPRSGDIPRTSRTNITFTIPTCRAAIRSSGSCRSSPEDRYADLPIHSGLVAYLRYAAMHSEAPQAKQTTIRQLLDYCRMDTYAMVEILHGLRAIVS